MKTDASPHRAFPALHRDALTCAPFALDDARVPQVCDLLKTSCSGVARKEGCVMQRLGRMSHASCTFTAMTEHVHDFTEDTTDDENLTPDAPNGAAQSASPIHCPDPLPARRLVDWHRLLAWHGRSVSGTLP